MNIRNIAKFTFLLFIIQTVSVGEGRSIPVIEVTSTTQSFTPTPVGQSSMYVVTPDHSYNGVVFHGKDGTQVTASLKNNLGYFNYANTVNDGSSLSSIFTSSYSSPKDDNPFTVEKQVFSPVAVRFGQNESSLTMATIEPFSLHFDTSFTFYAQANVIYTALINSSSGFLLDAYKREDAGTGYIMISNSSNMDNSFTTFDRQTFPVFSSRPNTEIMHVIQFFSTVNTMMTFTPHAFRQNDYHVDTLQANSTYFNTFEQGYCGNVENQMLTSATKKIKTIQTVDLEVKENTDYQLLIDITNLGESTTSLCQQGSITTSWLNSTTDFENIDGGSLQNEQITFSPHYNGSLTLLIIAEGNLNHDYLIFFRSVSKQTNPVQSLPLNQLTTLVFGTSYSITLDQPTMMAVNYSNSLGTSFTSDFQLQVQDPDLPKIWNTVTTSTTIAMEKGPLVTPNGGFTLGTNWVYMPEGEYHLLPTDNTIEDFNYTFNGVSIVSLDPATLNSSISLTMTNNSIVAFDFPLKMTQLTSVNISTTEHTNLTTVYDAVAIFKSRTFSPVTNSFTKIGNIKTTQGWIASPNNNTNLFNFPDWGDNYNPVILIYPRYSENKTQGTVRLTNVSTHLTVTAFYESDSARKYGQFFHPSTSSGTKQIAINSDQYQSSSNQEFFVPFETKPYKVYNVTVKAVGNFTSTSKNVTIKTLQVYSASNFNLGIFDPVNSWSTNTTNAKSQLILTDSTSSTIYIKIKRTGVPFRNGTLIISLVDMQIDLIQFEDRTYQNLAWNSTLLPGEVANGNTIYEINNFVARSNSDFVSDVGIPAVVIGGAGALGIGAMVLYQRRKMY